MRVSTLSRASERGVERDAEEGGAGDGEHGRQLSPRSLLTKNQELGGSPHGLAGVDVESKCDDESRPHFPPPLVVLRRRAASRRVYTSIRQV